MCQSKLSEEEMHDVDLVRAKVHDMAKLGEMKWRYRVVDEGQSPRECPLVTPVTPVTLERIRPRWLRAGDEATAFARYSRYSRYARYARSTRCRRRRGDPYPDGGEGAR